MARLPEYQIPLTAARRLLKIADERGWRFPEALSSARDIEDFDAPVKERFALLAGHLAGLEEQAAPWPFLAEYLFNRSDYLRGLLLDDSASARQKRLALYQFLQL